MAAMVSVRMAAISGFEKYHGNFDHFPAGMRHGQPGTDGIFCAPSLVVSMISHLFSVSGWWLTYPPEKYESQIGSSSQLLGKIKNVPNHQPGFSDFSNTTMGSH